MVRYFYLWTPFVVLGAVGVLLIPYLALIALLLVVLAVVAAFGWAIVSASLSVSRAVSRRRHGAGAQHA